MTPALVLKTIIDDMRIVPRWNMFTAAKHRLASSLGTKPRLLAQLARKINIAVQQRIAENCSTNSATLELLALHASTDVRASVAQNESTKRSTVNRLATDVSSDVRYAMADNAHTSTKLLLALADDENPYVQDRAKRTQARLQAEETLGCLSKAA